DEPDPDVAGSGRRSRIRRVRRALHAGCLVGCCAEAPGFEVTDLLQDRSTVLPSDLRKNLSGALRDRELAAPDGRTQRPAIQGTDMTRFPLTEAQSGLWYF